ncbi:MAG TPA: glycosyltransferase [Gammaproteobacteria bacterium]|jgi:glycosyltransferase involved in cell wall biosynthesis
MRILLVSSSYSQSGEGAAAAGVFVHDFAAALAESGVDTEVVAPALEAGMEQRGKLLVRRFRVPRLPLSLLNPLRPGDWLPIVNTLAAGRRAVRESCAAARPDHIFALWALPCGDWARHAARQHGIPYSTWALGSDIWSLGKLPLVRSYLASVLRDASHRFADGLKLGAEVSRISGRDCRFLPSSRAFGAPAPRSLAGAPPYRLAFLGRWHPNKGPDLLLEALAQLTDADWSKIEALRFCGGGPLEAQVHQRVEALVRGGRPVKMGGYLDHAAAYELFSWADFVVIPSRIESVPVVFSDAMQVGRPVIASPVGDLPEILQDYACGVLADDASAAGLVRALQRALTSGPGDFAPGVAKAAAAFDVRRSAEAFLAGVRQAAG